MDAAPHYSAVELTSCQVLNDLTAATLRLGLLRRSGLTSDQLVHVEELARCLEVAVATIAAAHVDTVVDAVREDTGAPRPLLLRPRPLPAFDLPYPGQEHGAHVAD